MIFNKNWWKRTILPGENKGRKLLAGHLFYSTKNFAIVEACVIGLVAAFAAVALKQGIGWLGGLRVYVVHSFTPWLLPVIGFSCGILAGWLVQCNSETSGSGIPYVKAVLAKVPLPLNLRISLVKLVGSILVIGAGLPLGRQGPTVQVGAALAAQISRWFPTSPDYRRQIIAAGAGAGLAAGFNTPIAGVLFVVEALLQDISGFTLGTAILASFIGAVVSRWLGGTGFVFDQITPLQTGFSPQEIPFYLLMGVLAGILGALFNNGIVAALNLNNRLRISLPLRVGLAGLICGVTIALLPDDFLDSAGLREILIGGKADWQLTLLAFTVQFLLTMLAYTTGAPGGLFAPVLIMGASLGLFIGLIQLNLLLTSASAPLTYALAGMGTFFTAVTRVPITGIVIVFEMTTDFNIVLPLMISSAIAYLIAEIVAPNSLYDRLLAGKGINLEESGKEGILTTLTAADVMQRRVETISSQITFVEAVQALSRSRHRNLPVVDRGTLVGIISQKELANYTDNSLVESIPISEIMFPSPMTAIPTATLAHILHLLNRYNLSCLPVTEGKHLVGMITRSDIIRATADHLDGAGIQTAPQPSYIVYQTRDPISGGGRLLILLSNPKTATSLLRIAIAIAQQLGYELECLHIIVVPRTCNPAETPISTVAGLNLLTQAIDFARASRVPIHTQIRVTHDVAEATLETIKERHIDLLFMGWKGTTGTPGKIFSRVADTLIRQAPCEVILAKFGDQTNFNRWLIPVAGGPNVSEAVQLLPAFASLGTIPKIELCTVYAPTETPDTKILEKFVQYLQPKFSRKVKVTTIPAYSVAQTIVSVAEKQKIDAIVMGATRETLLQQVIHGNIPETIARQSNCTVIIVRSA
ncbi:chloride channel protein [Calothrix rhizosoleniae]|uniref:chloride channel protein n=1 Tax=Calothrix rhizosoleniae TaxID=888997 RepID=UPI000B49BF30|nr:chloride channel protein [Calothrix rhizosoleniae]